MSMLPSIASSMKVDILFNQEGGVWIFHTEPLSSTLQWIEYDGDHDSVLFVLDNGDMQDLGLKIPSSYGMHMKTAKEANVMLVQGKQVTGHVTVPIVVRSTQE